LTAAEFFALGLDGGDMSAATRATGLAYTTVHRASKSTVKDVDTAKRLAAWSRTVPAAAEAGVWIDAARALGLDDSDDASKEVTDATRAA
jgi:hypothetical protein